MSDRPIPNEWFNLEGKDLVNALLKEVLESPHKDLNNENNLTTSIAMSLTGFYHIKNRSSGEEIAYPEMSVDDFVIPQGVQLTKEQLKKAYDDAVSAQEIYGDPRYRKGKKYSDKDEA